MTTGLYLITEAGEQRPLLKCIYKSRENAFHTNNVIRHVPPLLSYWGSFLDSAKEGANGRVLLGGLGLKRVVVRDRIPVWEHTLEVVCRVNPHEHSDAWRGRLCIFVDLETWRRLCGDQPSPEFPWPPPEFAPPAPGWKAVRYYDRPGELPASFPQEVTTSELMAWLGETFQKDESAAFSSEGGWRRR